MPRKFFILCFFSLIITFPVLAIPPDSLGMKIEGEKKFILHEVEQSQGLFAISRKYNVPVADIAEANPGMGEVLQPGDILLVPMYPLTRYERVLREYNEEQLLLHEVKKEETLYGISRQYEIPVEQIIYWNGIEDNNIRIGQKLLIDGPFIKAEEALKEKDSISVAETVKEEEVLSPAGAYQQQYNEILSHSNSQTEFMGSKWKINSERGMGSWIDEGAVISDKYLALHANAAPGTVMKVTNAMNGMSVYVKVIANLPSADISRNITIKLTKSAAEQLGVIDSVFRAEMSYAVKAK